MKILIEQAGKHKEVSTFSATPSMGSSLTPPSNRLSSFVSISSSSFGKSQTFAQRKARFPKIYVAKKLHFNKHGTAIKKLQAGVNKLADLVGVTLGLKGRNVVLESKYGSPRIVNDGATVAREVMVIFSYCIDGVFTK